MRSCTSRMMIGHAMTHLGTPPMTRNATKRRERSGCQTDPCMMTRRSRSRGDPRPGNWRMYATPLQVYDHCHHIPCHGSLRNTPRSTDRHHEGIGRSLPPNLTHRHDRVRRHLPSNTPCLCKGIERPFPPSPDCLKKVLKLERDSNRTALLLPRHLKQENWSQKCWKSPSACQPPTLPLQQLWWHPPVPRHASCLHLRIWMSTWRPQRLKRAEKARKVALLCSNDKTTKTIHSI